MSERRKMQAGDWANAAINAAIGVLLGSAADGLVQMATTEFWPVALIITLLSVGLFFLVVLSDKLLDRLFSIGVRPARHPRAEGRKPLLRVLSMPAGFVLGVVLARIGLDGAILGVIS